MKHLVTAIPYYGLLFVVLVSTIYIGAENPCAPCHGPNYYQDIRILYDKSEIPSEIAPGEYITMKIVFLNDCNADKYAILSEVNINITVLNGNIGITNGDITLKNIDKGEFEVTIEIYGIDIGPDIIVIQVNATNPHENVQLSGLFQIPINLPVEINTRVIDLSHSGKMTLKIKVVEDLKDLKFFVSDNISEYVSIEGKEYYIARNLYKDMVIELTIESTAPTNVEINGYILMVWHYNDGSGGQSVIPLVKRASQRSNVGVSYHLLGRIMGFLALGLLILSIILGGYPKGVKTKINMKIGGFRRIKLHCGISYLILALVLLHAILLMLRTYSKYALWIIFAIPGDKIGYGIILGDISFLLMLVVSITGIFQKGIIKRLGYKPWKYIHLYISIIAIILGLIHSIMIGTTFAIIRGD